MQTNLSLVFEEVIEAHVNPAVVKIEEQKSKALFSKNRAVLRILYTAARGKRERERERERERRRATPRFCRAHNNSNAHSFRDARALVM